MLKDETEIYAPLRYQVLADFESIKRVSDDWDRLVATGRRPEISMTFAWTCASQRAFGDQRLLHVVTVYKGCEVVGILPLTIYDRVVRFIGSPESDYNDFLASRTAGAQVLETALIGLFASGTVWNRCLFENIPENSNFSALRPKLPSHWRRRLRTVSHFSCPVLTLSTNCGSQARTIIGARRYQKYRNRIARSGHFAISRIMTPGEIDAHLSVFFKQHVRRWAYEGVQSQFVVPSRRRFFEELVRELAPESIHFSVVTLNGHAIAYHFGFWWGGKILFYKPTFDLDYWDVSPGTVLLLHLIKEATDADLLEFDFGVGGEWYKSRFCNGERTNATVVAYRSPARSLCFRFANAVKSLLQRVPGVWGSLRRITRSSALTAERVREMRGRRGALRSLKEAVRRIGRCVLIRETLLVFSTEGQSRPARFCSLELRSGRLSELAGLAALYPKEFPPDRLRLARERLKAGDRVFFTIRNELIVHVLWAGIRSEISAEYELGPKPRLRTSGQVQLLYDCWTPPVFRGQGIYSWTLRTFVGGVGDARFPSFICCLESNIASRRGIESAGFERCGNMGRTRALFGYEHSWAEWTADLPAKSGAPR